MTAMSPAERLLLTRALLRLRTERDLSLREASQLLGLDYTNLSRAETGVRRPLPAERIAAAFGVTVDEVLRPCPRCGYAPPAGFTCNRCGTVGSGGSDG